MKTTTAVMALVGAVSARDLTVMSRSSRVKREVPGEHAHQDILNIVNPILQANNPLDIKDAVFALLGNKAAAEGAPNVDNLDCLQQIVADQVFSNALADNNLEGMANAIIFRALERNTGSVGLASVLCNEQAENAAIAAITQHQDPASQEASGNADIELAVAVELAKIGADPLLALGSATFPPGEIGDPTAKGKTCDDANDDNGCINTLGLLTPAVSKAQIQSAVANVQVQNVGAGKQAAGNEAAGNEAAGNKAAASESNANANEGNQDNQAEAGAEGGQAQASATQNVQTFTGDLGVAAPPVISSQADAKRPFSVDGSTFVNKGAALQRSCAVQHTGCANQANSGADFSVSDCDAQQAQCNAANAKRRKLRLRRAALDFGSCGSPEISFGPGNDGRKEDSFIAVNQGDFNHGSALNIKVISDFICQQLDNKCDASAETVQTCDAASKAAQAAGGGKNQASADAFNKALGV